MSISSDFLSKAFVGILQLTICENFSQHMKYSELVFS